MSFQSTGLRAAAWTLTRTLDPVREAVGRRGADSLKVRASFGEREGVVHWTDLIVWGRWEVLSDIFLCYVCIDVRKGEGEGG
jgi:hypothetical protein